MSLGKMVELNSPIVVAAAAAFLAATTAYMWMLQRKKRLTNWVKVGDIGELWVYPLKSIQGVSVSKAEVTPVGLKHNHLRDRSFVVVKDTGNHVNPKVECYHMMSIQVEEVQEETKDVAIILKAPEMEPFTLYVEKCKNHVIPIKIFEFDMDAWDMGDDVARWLHQYLEKEAPSPETPLKYRLVMYDDSGTQVRRSRDRPKPYITLAHADDQILFPDFSALHLVCESSLEDLNKKLVEAGEDTKSSSFFRNNLYIKNTEAPFSEDQWKYLKIGNTVLRVIKRTHRCMLATVDPVTGKRNPRIEPLTTLRKYRLATTKQEREWYKEQPLIGLNLAVDKEGEINVGDEVYAVM